MIIDQIGHVTWDKSRVWVLHLHIGHHHIILFDRLISLKSLSSNQVLLNLKSINIIIVKTFLCWVRIRPNNLQRPLMSHQHIFIVLNSQSMFSNVTIHMIPQHMVAFKLADLSVLAIPWGRRGLHIWGHHFIPHESTLHCWVIQTLYNEKNTIITMDVGDDIMKRMMKKECLNWHNLVNGFHWTHPLNIDQHNPASDSHHIYEIMVIYET